MNFEVENSIKSRKDWEISTPKTCSKQNSIVERLGDGFGRVWGGPQERLGMVWDVYGFACCFGGFVVIVRFVMDL